MARRPRITLGTALLLLVIASLVAVILFQNIAARRQMDEARRGEQALHEFSSLCASVIERKRELHRGVEPVRVRRDLQELLARADAYVRAWPDDPRGFYVRARARLSLDQRDAAERDLREAVGRAPEFRPGWTLLGVMRVERAAMREAAEAFALGWPAGREHEEAARWGLAWSRDEDVLREVAAALRRWAEGHRDAAVAMLTHAHAERPSEEYANWLGVLTRDSTWHSRAIELAPGYAKAWLDRGIERYGRGDRTGAIADYDRAIELCPSLVAARLNRARARRASGDLTGALEDVDDVIEREPGQADAYLVRGTIREAVGDAGAAFADFDRAIALRPDSAEAWAARGLSLASRGEDARALADFARALELAPSASVYAARAELRLRHRDFDEALADADRAIELDPALPRVRLARARVYQHRGDLKRALYDLDDAIRLDPRSVDAWLQHARVHAEMGHLERALTSLERAIAIDPRNPDSYVELGFLRQRRQESEAGDFSRALDVAPAGWPRRREVEELLRLARE